MSVAWPAKGRRWTDAELCADAAAAVAEVQARRLGEDRALISKLGNLLSESETDTAFVQSLCSTESGRTAFRCLGAPPNDGIEGRARRYRAAVPTGRRSSKSGEAQS